METFYCNNCDSEFTEEELQIHQNHSPDDEDECIYCGSKYITDGFEEYRRLED